MLFARAALSTAILYSLVQSAAAVMVEMICTPGAKMKAPAFKMAHVAALSQDHTI
jgi:hypothetical protein